VFTTPCGEKTDDVRFLAATVLVAGCSRAEIAQKLNVSERTLTTCSNTDEEFQELIRDMRAEVLNKVTGELAQHLALARQTLVRALNSKVVHAEARAAVAPFDLYFRSQEIGEMRERIASLEQQMAEQEEAYP